VIFGFWLTCWEIGDCEIGTTRKACKNCSCGRAEEEEKVLKLGLTAEQINNPQSACGSVRLSSLFWLNQSVGPYRLYLKIKSVFSAKIL
jgi:hypothetical protein